MAGLDSHEVFGATISSLNVGNATTQLDGSAKFDILVGFPKIITFPFVLYRTSEAGKGTKINSIVLNYKLTSGTLTSIAPVLTRISHTDGADEVRTNIPLDATVFTLTPHPTNYNRIQIDVTTPSFDNQSAATSISYEFALTITATTTASMQLSGIDVRHLLDVPGGSGGFDAVTAVTPNTDLTLSGNGTGGVVLNGGTQGIRADTTGLISLDSTSTTASSNLTTVGAAGFDLTVNSTAGSLNLRGGEAAADAVRINTTNAAGGIDIDAGTAGITIDSTGSVSIDSSSTTVPMNLSLVGATGVDLTVSNTAGSVNITSGEGVANAIRVLASDVAGGIDIDCGNGGFAVDSTGPISLDSTATGSSSNITHSGAAGFDLNISCVAGSTNISAGEAISNAITIDSQNGGIVSTSVLQTNISSSEAASNAIRINASNAAGGIDVDAGSAGVAIDTTGALSFDATSTTAASNLTHVGAAGFDLTVSATSSSLNLSAGEADADAIRINASAGGVNSTSVLQTNIDSSQAAANAIRINASNAAGGIDIDAGSAGVAIDTTGALSFDATSTTTASNLTHVGAAGFDLTVSATLSSLNLLAGEAATDAVRINASNAAGGIDIDAGTAGIAVDTTGTYTLTAASSLGGVNIANETTFHRSTGRYYLEEFFKRRPDLNANIALDTSNKDFEITGTNIATATIAFSSTFAGVSLTTAGANGDQVIVQPHTDTNQSAWTGILWGTENQSEWECAVRTGANVTNVILWAGLKLTNTHVIATDNDQVFFRYSTTDGNTTVRVIDSIAGTDTNTDSGVAVAGDTTFRLRITIDSTRVARCYINDTLVRTTSTLVNDVDLIPYVGIQAETALTKTLNLAYEKISRILFE